MKSRWNVSLLLLLLFTACKKESSSTATLLLGTFEKDRLYKIKQEVTYPGTDSVFVFKGDSLFPGIPFVIQFKDSELLIANSCQSYLFNHFYTCNSAYHTQGAQLLIENFNSLHYNRSPALFNLLTTGGDTILASTDGAYEMYLSVTP